MALLFWGSLLNKVGEISKQRRQGCEERRHGGQALPDARERYHDLMLTAQRQAQELSLLDRVRTALACEMEMPVILHTVVEAIASTFDYQLVSLYILKGDRLVLQHQVGYDQVIHEIPKDKGISWQVMHSSHPILLEDVRENPAFLGAIDDIVSEVAVPLFLRGEAIGVLNVESTRGVRLGEADLRLLIALGKNIDIAFERAQLYAEARESEARYRTSIETLLDGFAVFSAIRDATGRIDDFRYEYINQAGCLLNQRSREEHLGRTLLELFPEHKEASILAEYAQLVETGQPLSKEALLYEDVYGEGQLLNRAYDIRAVKLGDGFAVTWRDVTERMQMETAERQQRALAEALADTAAILTSSLELDEVLNHVLDNAERVVPHQNANIMLVENGVARIAGSRGYADAVMEAAARSLRLFVADILNLRQMSTTGKPMVIPDTGSYAAWLDIPSTRWIKSYAGAPIRIKGETVGFINLNAATPGFFSQADAERLQAFANQAAVAIENARLYAQTQQLAITDELTGIFNRRGLFDEGRREIERARRLGYPLSAVLLDIDHFKAVNDTHGHSVGDQVLKDLVCRCQENIREIDVIARYGGEEFMILLPECNLFDSQAVAERLRQAVFNEPFETMGGKVSISVSLGVSTFANQSNDLSCLIESADQALYNAKQTGRNCVAVK